MKKATIQLETLTCPSCLQKIESGIKQIDGVKQENIKVLFNASKVKVAFDESKTSVEEIEKTIQDLGYGVIKSRVA
ncbi:MAG TPA: heavy-metal-associated domain-containing protein [Alloiococcus sp.]|nr:heavy-metal-associated domain-containing protein [Alloiococcus sp.]